MAREMFPDLLLNQSIENFISQAGNMGCGVRGQIITFGSLFVFPKTIAEKYYK